MLKRYEEALPNSCWNKAHPDELVFVLLGRDAAAHVAIGAWIEERLRTGKNKPDDAQIQEAEALVFAMRKQSREPKPELPSASD